MSPGGDLKKIGAYKDSKLNKFVAPLIAGNNQAS